MAKTVPERRPLRVFLPFYTVLSYRNKAGSNTLCNSRLIFFGVPNDI